MDPLPGGGIVIAPPTPFQASLIVAPEGYGKSERVRELVEGSDRPVMHFYAKTDQTSLFDLLYGFVQCAAPLGQGMISSFASAVEYARGAPDPPEELALWLLRHLEGARGIFVVHDLDRIPDARFVELLRRVVEGTESSVRWIFVARSVPALPWDDWKAFGIAGPPCTADDLQLTQSQALALAAKYGVDDALALELLHQAGGWPLGYTLRLHSARKLGPHSTDPIADALQRIDPAVADTLSDTSVLAEFDPAFAAAAGFATMWGAIAQIADEGLVLVHLPEGTVRFRDAFRAAFEERLAARGARAVQAARESAARAYEGSGRLLTALRLYSAWGASADVLRLCCRHGFDVLEKGHATALHVALQSIQRELLHESAVALCIMAMEEARAGRHDIAEAWFLQAIARASDSEQRAEVAYRYVLERVRAGHLDGLELLEPYLHDTGLPVELRAAVSSTLATAYVLAERFAEAHAAIEQALNSAEQHGDPVVLAKILHHAAWVALFTGDVARARVIGTRAVSTALLCSLYDWAARACTVLYNIAYDIEDDPAESSKLLEQILDLGMQAGSAPMRLFALLGKFDLATERGDAQSLQRIERSLLSYELHFSDPLTSASLISGQALFLAGRSRYAEAHDLLVPTAERQPTKDRRALRFSEMALYAAAAGRRAAASEAAAHVEELLPTLQGDRRLIRAQANVLLAYRLLGCNARAAELLADLEQRRDTLAPRARSFVEAVSAVATRWNNVANRSVLVSRLDTMQARDLGGYAALLTSLPLEPGAADAEKTGGGGPTKQNAWLNDHREAIVASALDTCTGQLRRTLLCDLIASAVLDRFAQWLKTRDDNALIEWSQRELERRHNLDAAAHLFGDTIGAAVKALRQAGLLDPDTQNDAQSLREALDAHVSATQVRLAAEFVDPVDPVDAKIDELLRRLFMRDEITFEHSRCVGAWCARLAKRMHLTRADGQLVMRSGLIHDIGKVLTPPEILKAPRRLSETEWSVMRRHTLDGVRLIEPQSELRSLIPAIRWHHERYDGKGYPDAMPLQDIPFAARIVAVADAFNAMIARRPYRDPIAPSAAISELKRASGTQFDPAVVSNMIDVVLRPDR